MFAPIESAAEATLNEEERGASRPTAPSRIPIDLGPHQIKTLRIRHAGAAR